MGGDTMTLNVELAFFSLLLFLLFLHDIYIRVLLLSLLYFLFPFFFVLG